MILIFDNGADYSDHAIEFIDSDGFPDEFAVEVMRLAPWYTKYELIGKAEHIEWRVEPYGTRELLHGISFYQLADAVHVIVASWEKWSVQWTQVLESVYNAPARSRDSARFQAQFEEMAECHRDTTPALYATVQGLIKKDAARPVFNGTEWVYG